MIELLVKILVMTLTIIAIAAFGVYTIREVVDLQNMMIERDIDELKKKYCE